MELGYPNESLSEQHRTQRISYYSVNQSIHNIV